MREDISPKFDEKVNKCRSDINNSMSSTLTWLAKIFLERFQKAQYSQTHPRRNLFAPFAIDELYKETLTYCLSTYFVHSNPRNKRGKRNDSDKKQINELNHVLALSNTTFGYLCLYFGPTLATSRVGLHAIRKYLQLESVEAGNAHTVEDKQANSPTAVALQPLYEKVFKYYCGK